MKELLDPNTGTRLKILKTARDTQSKGFEVEILYPPGRGKEGQQPHFHTSFEERYEVLSGSATYLLNGVEQQVSAGNRFYIPPNTPHLNPYNRGQEELRIRQWIELEQQGRKTLEAFEDFVETGFGLAKEGKKVGLLQAAVLLQALQPSSYAAGLPIRAQQVLFKVLAGIGRMLGYSTRYARFAVPAEAYEPPTADPANQYHFLDRWLIPAPIEVVWEYLRNGEDYPRWWNSVYDAMTKEVEGDSDGLGRVYACTVHGALPYKLKLKLESAYVDKPYRMEVRSTGDLEGRGIWRLKSVQGGTEVTYDWKVRATFPLIRALSGVLKPLFEYNHTWCMQHGEHDLQQELLVKNQTATVLV